MIRTNLVLAAGTLLLLSTAAHAGGGANACSALRDLKLDHGRVVATHEVSAGKDYTFANLVMRVAAGMPLLDLPASCRVELELTPSADSQIRVQVWMPQDGWNQKFQGVGNGGFAGSIDKLSLSNALRQRYAAASTDTGHEASDRDGSWALNHPEKALDYFSRAIHEMTVAAKIVVTAYYGHAPKYSYFGSASNGGRQALIEAQRYPDDYIGILAGAPALSPTTELTGWGWIQQQLHKPGAYLSPDKLPAIAAATLAACDANDGVKDGVIDDPRACHFDPSTLLCHGRQTDACLTAPQIDGLRAVYSGPGGSGPGGAYHGYFPGAETGKGGWQPWITGSKPKTAFQYVYVQEFVRNLVYDDASWSADDFDLKRDEAAIYRKLHAMDSADVDLSRFVARGGKLILYHGWNDPALSPQTTLDY
jgi:feruloyl esterase